MTEYFKVGKIVGTHGISGQVVLQHSLGAGADWKQIKIIFLEEQRDTFIPWFLTQTVVKNPQEVFLMFEDIQSKEEATPLLKKEVWLSKEDFDSLVAKDTPIAWLGYTIYDRKIRIGDIEEVIEQRHQILCKVTWENKELLIPIHEDFLKKIDHKNRKIIVELPDGLLEIYKES